MTTTFGKMESLANTKYYEIKTDHVYAYKIAKDDISLPFLKSFYNVSKYVNSDHLVKVYGIDEEKVMMDLYKTDLQRAARQYKFSYLLKIFYDVCLGVKDLHDKNVCHNDLKPGNILIKEDKGFIGDLDSCLLCNNDKVEIDEELTTYCFAAPETYKDKLSVYSKEGDIWALGCTLLFLVTGYLLFSSTYDEYKGFFNDLKEERDLIALIDYYVKQWKRDELRKEALELVKKMLVLNKDKRAKIEEVINDKVFDRFK